MGDRCYVEATFKEVDLPIVTDVLGDYFETEVKDGIAEIKLDEINYGAYDEFDTLAREHKLEFTGYSSTGSN